MRRGDERGGVQECGERAAASTVIAATNHGTNPT